MSQTILITGTSTGFGKLIAQTSASKGHRVIATMRAVNGKNEAQAKDLQAFGDSQPGSIEVLELDVASDASVKDAMELISSKYEYTRRTDIIEVNAARRSIISSVLSIGLILKGNVFIVFGKCGGN